MDEIGSKVSAKKGMRKIGTSKTMKIEESLVGILAEAEPDILLVICTGYLYLFHLAVPVL